MENSKFIENLKIKQYPAYPAEFIVFLCVTLFRQKMAEKRYTICILLMEYQPDIKEERQKGNNKIAISRTNGALMSGYSFVLIIRITVDVRNCTKCILESWAKLSN